MKGKVQKITPFLWFDDRAEEAATFYVSIFPDSEIVNVLRYGPAGPGAEGSAMTVSFTLEGQAFTALNGGPLFAFTEAISFVVDCETQEEVDYYWERLCEGGEESMCGWLKDRYGLSWQIVPRALYEYVGGPDPAGSQRATEAMLGMKKLEVAALRRAYEGS